MILFVCFHIFIYFISVLCVDLIYENDNNNNNNIFQYFKNINTKINRNIFLNYDELFLITDS